MKVGALITLLQAYNSDDIVILAKDGEGNGFSPVAELTGDMYEAENTRSGILKLRELTPELKAKGWEQEDIGEEGAVNCVTLWPVN